MTLKNINQPPTYDSDVAVDVLRSNLSLIKKIKWFMVVARKIQEYLEKNPQDWLKFQETLNILLDELSGNIGELETSGSKSEYLRAKSFFVKRLQKHFVYGKYIKASLFKPFGYAGDFKIIDEIYQNCPESDGYTRLWDNYFLRMGPAIATRNRKEDFIRLLSGLLEKNANPARIMDLASGPCRDIYELIKSNKISKSVIIDCYDFDPNAIAYGKQLMVDLNAETQVSFYQKNAYRFAKTSAITKYIKFQYDIVFSTGLFDYLNDDIAVSLIRNLKILLKTQGYLCISNYTKKSQNPWASLMEWVCDWNLIYRSEEEFKNLFFKAGFSSSQINFEHERLGIMQYCIARNES